MTSIDESPPARSLREGSPFSAREASSVAQQRRHRAGLGESIDGIDEVGLGAGEGEQLDQLVDQVDLEDLGRLADRAGTRLARLCSQKILTPV
jgi:hypothetical protein